MDDVKRCIFESGLFDSKWYSERYPDVKATTLDPLDHYLYIGAFLGRRPSNAFLPEEMANPTGARHALPLLDFIKRNKVAFDPGWYLKRNQDVARAKKDPYAHYLAYGFKEGRPSNGMSEMAKDFDAAWYWEKYLSSENYSGSPLIHYCNVGSALGYFPSRKGRSIISEYRRFGHIEYGASTENVIHFDEATSIQDGFDMSVAVHMHVFYEEYLEEMCSSLANIPVDFTLFVSLTVDQFETEDIRNRLRNDLPHVRTIIIRETPNRGRDIAPFLVEFGKEIAEFDLVLHIHSKRTLHNPAHVGWRRYLLHCVCGNRDTVSQMLNSFYEDEKMGAIFPPYYPTLRLQPSWGRNYGKVASILEKMRLGSAPVDCPNYPAGSFFWARTAALKPLLMGALSLEDFDVESGQIDGTTAHAVERLFGLLPLKLGYKSEARYTDVAYNLVNFYSRERTFTERPDRSADVQSYIDARKQTGRQARIAVATAIIGDYDVLQLPEHIDNDVDYFCFSDSRIDGYDVFEIRTVDYSNDDPRRVARYIKTNLLHLLKGYDFLIWVDSNVQIRGSVNNFISMMEKSDAAVGVIYHPIRSSYLDEAKEIIARKLDDQDVVQAQVGTYRNVINLEDDRLIETNFMIFNARDSHAVAFADLWWDEIQKKSKRDQLSVNYALRKSGIQTQSLLDDGYSCRDHPSFRLFFHGTTPQVMLSRHQRDDGSIRAGTLGRVISLPPVGTVDDLLSSTTDCSLLVDRIIDQSDVSVTDHIRGSAANIADLETNTLANGVSVSNWIPSRWITPKWEANIEISCLHQAVCFGGLISRTYPNYHESGQLFLTRDGNLLESTFGVWNGEGLIPNNLLKKVDEDQWRLLQSPSYDVLDGKYLLLGSLQPHFGHSLLEGLSRVWPLHISNAFRDEMKYLVFEPALRDYHKVFLQHAGIDLEQVVHVPATGVRVERLYVPTPSIRSHRWISRLQGKTWAAISDSVSSREPTRRVYLTRQNISERPLLNEEQVAACFSEFGYEVVAPETLTVEEQIEMAATSTHLAGPVGSQMYLGAFQKRGGKKLIIAPANFYAKDDLLISRVTKGTCDVAFGTKTDNFSDRDKRSWYIDIDKVRGALLRHTG
ncbi:rhamnan synthesis F family protein [Corticibacterium sp. UT-5YL-CI-8]|nr:rhamnan synthesis F family protein [Tianweitania sp. UT-5YL-CI-8]